jgi:hypothetical protein
MASQTAPNPFDKTAKARELALDPQAVATALSTVPTARPRDLHTFHRNPRQGDVPAIKRSLLAHGQYKPIVVNRGTHTGRPNEVLAGNHTLMAIRELAVESDGDPHWDAVLVHWLDVDDDMCNRIVAADNQTARLGGFDDAELASLLADIGEVNLADIGFSDDDLADLRAKLEENAAGLPPRPEGLHDISHNPNTADPARHDNYEQTMTRAMILTMPISQFVWAQEQLSTLRELFGVDNNVDMVLKMIADATNTEIPDADEQVSDEALDAAEQVAQ